MRKNHFTYSLLVLLLAVLFIPACNTDNILPSTDFQTSADGCVDFTVYKYSTDTLMGLVVHGSRDSLGLELTDKTFDLATETDLAVRLEEFNAVAYTFYCDDVAGDDPNVINTWIATKGSARIHIIEDSVSVFPWGATYTLQVVLEDVELEDDAGNVKEIITISFNNVLVGWLPG